MLKVRPLSRSRFNLCGEPLVRQSFSRPLNVLTSCKGASVHPTLPPLEQSDVHYVFLHICSPPRIS